MMGFQKGLAGQRSATNLQPPQNTLNKSIGGANSSMKQPTQSSAAKLNSSLSNKIQSSNQKDKPMPGPLNQKFKSQLSPRQ
jgi:hypothetical protein